MGRYLAGPMGCSDVWGEALFVVDDWDHFRRLRGEFRHARIVHVNAILDAALLPVVYKFTAVVVTPSIDTGSDWFHSEVVSRMAPGAPVYTLIPSGGLVANIQKPET